MRFKGLFHRQRASNVKLDETVFNQYCQEPPTSQTAIDALTGWNSAFPPSAQVQAGNHPLYSDTRIEWALQRAGPIADQRILEIGPLEGMHTFMLNQHKPAFIDAIEANKQCFLRCLVSKEILSIDRARFHLGDATKWLEAEDRRYDLAIASGVLYHMADPAYFLRLLASSCDQLFIWTHYFSDVAMPLGDPRRSAFSGEKIERDIDGVSVAYHERRYFHANEKNTFCGGLKDQHYWMDRKDILNLLKSFGLIHLEIAHEDTGHSGGPCFSVFAKRA